MPVILPHLTPTFGPSFRWRGPLCGSLSNRAWGRTCPSGRPTLQAICCTTSRSTDEFNNFKNFFNSVATTAPSWYYLSSVLGQKLRNWLAYSIEKAYPGLQPAVLPVAVCRRCIRQYSACSVLVPRARRMRGMDVRQTHSFLLTSSLRSTQLPQQTCVDSSTSTVIAWWYSANGARTRSRR